MHAPLSATAAPPQASQGDVLLRLIADSVPALMAYYELPGLRCRFANQGYAAYNGHSTQSILGLTVEEAIGTRAWEAIRPHVDRCMVGERVKYTREQTLPNSEIR
ncbi:MAG: PAS domain-containing protein, partial [Giesbergeria sp.]